MMTATITRAAITIPAIAPALRSSSSSSSILGSTVVGESDGAEQT